MILLMRLCRPDLQVLPSSHFCKHLQKSTGVGGSLTVARFDSDKSLLLPIVTPCKEGLRDQERPAQCKPPPIQLLSETHTRYCVTGRRPSQMPWPPTSSPLAHATAMTGSQRMCMILKYSRTGTAQVMFCLEQHFCTFGIDPAHQLVLFH